MILFDGRDIRVVSRILDTDRPDLVITFTGRAAKPPVEKGFGEVYLGKRGVSAIHFISKANHWWQTAEPLEAIALLKKQGLLPPERRLTLYGSSMGGYAALIYSGILKPAQVVVFSPQYSIDPRKVPFEMRWRNYAAQLSFDHDDLAAGIDPDTHIRVIYDPFFEPDARHVAMLDALRPMEHVSVPLAGHNTARVLGELNLITAMTDSLILGGFDKKAFALGYRDKRDQACLFWHGLSETLIQHQNDAGAALSALAAALILQNGGRMQDRALKLDILHAAVFAAYQLRRTRVAADYFGVIEGLDPTSHRTQFARAMTLALSDDLPGAITAARAALEAKHGDVRYAALLCELLIQNGEAAAIDAVIEKLPATITQSPAILTVKAAAMAALGETEGAKEVLRIACREKRRTVSARVLLARCWAETGRPDAAPKQLKPVLDRVVVDPRHTAEIVQLMTDADAQDRIDDFARRQSKFEAAVDALTTDIPSNWTNLPAVVADMRRRVRRALRR